MFGTVQRVVEAYLGRHPRLGVRTDRVVTFDVTNRRIDGTCYLFFAAEGPSPVLVAKAARTPAGRAVFEIEYDNLRTLVARGLNDGRETVPAPLDLRREGELLVTLQSALPGTLMKNVPGAELFSAERAEASAERVLDWWHLFQDRLGTREVVLDGDEYDRHVAAEVRRFVRRYRLRDEERELLERRFGTEAPLRGARLPLMARHGDFCAANLVLDGDGVGVFDWEFPLEHHTPLFDLFFFFSSLRFPYDGRGGESSHFESFEATYWEPSYFRDLARRTLAGAAERHGVPRERLGDLLVLSSVQIANMKYDGLLVSHGMRELEGQPDDAAKRERWEAFEKPDKDAPFARLRDGYFENLGLLARRGVPEL